MARWDEPGRLLYWHPGGRAEASSAEVAQAAALADQSGSVAVLNLSRSVSLKCVRRCFEPPRAESRDFPSAAPNQTSLHPFIPTRNPGESLGAWFNCLIEVWGVVYEAGM